MKQVVAVSISTAIIVLSWYLYAILVVRSDVVFPPPQAVLVEMVTEFPRISWHVGLSMLEALVGFLFAAALGYGTALAFYLSPSVKDGLYPYAIALKATPLIAIAPILVLWVGDGFVGKAIMAAVVAFFPILVASYIGLQRYGSESLIFFQTLGASRKFVLTRIVIPGSVPFLFSGLRIGSTLAVVGAIIGEFTGASAGAGYLIKTYAYYLETDRVFATIILLGAASVLVFFAVSLIERAVVFWERIE